MRIALFEPESAGNVGAVIADGQPMTRTGARTKVAAAATPSSTTAARTCTGLAPASAEAARLANEAAGVVVGKFGPATVSPAELLLNV